jgi:DNA-binding NarL/FixJ family response regulator
VLVLLAQGYSNRDIAERLVLAEGTVKNHVSNILAKLQAQNRTQAAAMARS